LGLEERAGDWAAAGGDVYVEDPALRGPGGPREGAAAP
jgi:hypothetical protein